MCAIGNRKRFLFERADTLSIAFGTVYFTITFGLQKLSPGNIAWLTNGDHHAGYLGWRFFAQDSWRWPPGMFSGYGWRGDLSIVNSGLGLWDVGLKVLNFTITDEGQSWGLLSLLSVLVLFILTARLFRELGLSQTQAQIGSVILSTTPLFWWTQRLWLNFSTMAPLLVIAIYLYIRGRRESMFPIFKWLVLLFLTAGLNPFFLFLILPLFSVALVHQALSPKSNMFWLAAKVACTPLVIASAFYLVGYLDDSGMPLRSSGWGVFSTNILGLLDPNGVSWLLPDLPSFPLQYDAVYLGTGAVFLFVVTLSLLFRVHESLLKVIRRHWLLSICLSAMWLFSLSTYLSFGKHVYRIPIPVRLENWLGIFRSSSRFAYPFIVGLVILLVVIVSRIPKYGTYLLLLAMLIQVFDMSNSLRYTARQANGEALPIEYDEILWNAVPFQYGKIAIHPVWNAPDGWDECAYAAVQTERETNCAYFARASAPELNAINERESLRLLIGDYNESSIYWISSEFVRENLEELDTMLNSPENGFALPRESSATFGKMVLFFPNCEQYQKCTFLDKRRVEFAQIVEYIQE